MSLSLNHGVFIAIVCGSQPVCAQSNSSYPEGPLTAEEIAQQVHLVTHGGLVHNALSKPNKDEVALIINSLFQVESFSEVRNHI